MISAAWPEIFCSWSALCSVNIQLENAGNAMAGVFRIDQYKEEDVPLNSKNPVQHHEEVENGKCGGAFTPLTSITKDICSYWLRETCNWKKR